MITDITLTNFKCFHRINVAPKRVTLLIGGNGTGKSGLLQALLLLKQWDTQSNALSLEGDLVRIDPDDFANYVIPAKSPEIWFSLSGEWTVASNDVQSPVVFQIQFRFSTEATLQAKLVYAYFVWRGRTIQIQQIPNTQTLGEIRSQGFDHTIAAASGLELGDLRINRAIGVDGADVAPVRQALESPKTLLSNMRFVPAIRGFARGTYALGSELQDVLVSASGLSAQEEDTITALAYSPREVEQVSVWMNQVTGVGLKTYLVPPRTVKPVSVTTAGQPNLLSEGSGTNALVQLLFELARAGHGDTVLIEEPEIHLHPKAQAELASVIVAEAKSSNKQVVMTTHSEHIAGRLMTEIAEGNVSVDEIAIYSFDKDTNGVCSADLIELTDSGQATGGLRSFFQTDLDEMRRYVDALRAKA